MHRTPRPLAVALALALASPALAGDASPAPAPPPPADTSRLDALERRLEEQARENAALREEVEALKRKQAEATPARAGGDATEEKAAGANERARGDTWPERAEESLERLGTAGGIYAKPFLKRFGRAYLGGYMDLEYRDPESGDREFVAHRFIPFIYADVTEQVKVAAEIEFEYGGVGGQANGDVKLEFAFVDYVFDDAFALRAGIILVPLGKFNLIHDSPVNDLTDRPLVARFIIPTTFSEAGVGVYGSLYPFGEAKLDYELYVGNGFRGLVENGSGGLQSRFDDTSGVRGGRPRFRQDIDNNLAVMGRIAFSPFLGIEVGGSGHAGNYDQHAGDLLLAIYAFDATLQLGRLARALEGLEIQGEIARADIERNAEARAASVPDDLWGMYWQVNYHFMFDVLREWAPIPFGEESTFTAVVRYDHVELDDRRTNVITPGLNFRPTEETVFKLEYQLDFENWKRNAVRDDAFVASVATYF